MLQLTAMPTLAEAVVESFLTMLDAEELSPLFSAAQIVELVSTAVNTVKMLELNAEVFAIYNLVFSSLDVCFFVTKQ